MGNKNKIAGIYKIVSPTGKVYIGQSYNIHKRWYQHKFNHSKLDCALYRSFNKYGIPSHEFSILKELPNDAPKETLTRHEQEFMDYYRSQGVAMLNMTTAAGSTRGRLCTDETRNKISKALTGKPPIVFTDEIRKKISDALKGNKHTLGRKFTPEQCQAITDRQIGKPGKIPNAETRRKMSIAQRGKKMPPRTEEHKRNLSKSLKGTRASVGRVLSEETKQKISAGVKERNLSLRKQQSLFNI